MGGILIRIAITALGLWVAATLVPGINISPPRTLIIAALLMGVVNALVRPLLVLLTLPLTILTLGLFLLVINAAMFGLVARVLDGFSVSGFFAALAGWLIVSVISTIASWFVGSNER